MIKKCVVSEGRAVTFDNMFTSLSFLDELSELRIGDFGTLRQNRVQNASVQSLEHFVKTVYKMLLFSQSYN